MKILMVNKFLFPKGGAETYMLKLGNHLAALGNEVEYFGMDSEDRCVSNRAQSYTDNVDFRKTSAIKKLKYSFKSIYSVEARQKISRVLDDFKPDIVHLNNINFQLTPSIIYEIKKRNIPIVQTVHDVQIACPNHKMFIEEKGKVCSECLNGNYTHCIKNKCVHSSMLKSILACAESYIYHHKDTYNLVDRYICPSLFIADMIIKGGVDRKKTVVMHNYCESPGNIPKENDKKYVLYFGRLSIEKGIKTLVDACKELENINFVFAGTGPLEGICKNIKNITAVGFKSGNELKELISNACFCVCPSEWYENCPMTVVESLALGTPVIVSDLGGAKELVSSGKTGLIFKAGDKDALKEAITHLYNDEEALKKMSAECIRQSNNTIERYTEKLCDIYSQLIS